MTARTEHAPYSPASPWTAEALEVLDVDQLALIVFDASLPGAESWDTGSGSPYSSTAWDFFRFARELGFNAVQFGPQGAVSRSNPSPYDGTAFSRNPMAIALEQLASPARDGGWELLSAEDVQAVLRERPAGVEQRVAHTFAYDSIAALLAKATAHPNIARDDERKQRYAAFVEQHGWWLRADAIYAALCERNSGRDSTHWATGSDGADDARLWNELGAPTSSADGLFGHTLPNARQVRLEYLHAELAKEIAAYSWTQFIVHEQHRAFQRKCSQLGLSLYGDMQVGYGRQDCWHFNALFLKGYAMGAPPSRTNPEGQAWGYPVLDPDLYTRPDAQGDGMGPALQLLAARARKQFSEYSRVRVDHPHGLVCPWVYQQDTGDDLRAVQNGARLFSSPDLPDHPQLARYSIVGETYIDANVPRYHERRVRSLTPAQVRLFARGMNVLAEQARARGGVDHLVCEVLSTLPFELRAVLDEYGLGRFRVTQKSNLRDPHDVYRSENAQPQDWMLLGNHDTPPVWHVVKRWQQNGELRDRADYLASRLSCDDEHRRALARRFREDMSELVHGALADLFASRSRNVLISFTDLFGWEQTFNQPGVVSSDNWSLRIPRDFAHQYHSQSRVGHALSLQRALRLALERVAPGSALLRASNV